jgi:hypothetical protein
MDKLLEILDKHKNQEIISYRISFDKPSLLTIKFKDGTILELSEVLRKDK